MNKKKATKEKPTTFAQLFRLKKESEKASELAAKKKSEYMSLLRRSAHLDKQIASVGNRSWYVSIHIPDERRWYDDPNITFSPIVKP